VRAHLGPVPAGRETVRGEALMAILVTEQGKFGLPASRHNFRGWNKTMVYAFPDLGESYAIRFVAGEALPPERVEHEPPQAEITYTMDTWVLQAMSAGDLSGEAPFTDLMKLQSLNKV
jgi:hypothetical protein